MYPSSGVWCRALVWALLVAMGASLDLYDQPQSLEDLFYQDVNDIDTGPMEESRPLPRPSNVMLRKMIQALQLADDRNPYRSSEPSEAIQPTLNDRYFKQHAPEYAQFKGTMSKRLAEVFGSHLMGYKSNESTRPQQKWKTKKGKAIGSQMVCYFKLCAFRSPA